MAESELSFKYADLLLEVAVFLGYGSDPDKWPAEVDLHVQAGVRRFYYPPAAEGIEDGYSWSFLSPVATLDTTADDAAQDLPDSLSRVVGDFHYEQAHHRPSIVQVSEGRYQALLSSSESTGSPKVARVRHKEKGAATGQRLEVAWWPVPDGAYTLTYRYEAYSGKLSEDNPYPLGGMKHTELLIESCLAVAEQRANDERGLHTAEFERALKAAIQQDRKAGTRYYGHMGSFEGHSVVPRHGDTGSSYPITYDGETH